MTKTDCRNPVVDQVFDSVNFTKQMGKNMSMDYLSDAVPDSVLLGAKEIICTGCGDSWLAGLAAKNAFYEIAGVELKVMRNIEFTRHYPKEKLEGMGDKTLVIGISISGTVSRVVEAMKRASHYGVNSLAITENPESPVGLAAKYIAQLRMPPLEQTYGVSSYNASTLTLMHLAIKIALLRDRINSLKAQEYMRAIQDYVDSFTAAMDGIDDKMFEVAKKWQGKKSFEFVGDDTDFVTSVFGAYKFAEAFGGTAGYEDSENWCHVGYFFREPEKIGTALCVDKESPSYRRVLETFKAMIDVGRDVLVVTDADASEFDGADVCTIPAAKFSWITPLMQHLPYDILASYIAKLQGHESFRADEPTDNWTEPDGVDRIRKNEIIVM